jgi:hypothetical protein
MKNTLFSVLIALLVLPAFTPWMPHGMVHALHDHQESHHQSRQQADQDHGHEHAVHDHDTQTHASDHHPINLDIATYFSEYLHVDLQSPDQVVLKAPTLDLHDISFILPTDIEPQHRYKQASVQSRAPPDWRRHRPDNTPLYLSTQRLRI